VILEDGTIEAGRPPYWQGAHTKGYNHSAIGICLIGEGGDATEAQMKALKAAVRVYKPMFNTSDREIHVVGHCDLDANKPDCPGFDVRAWWESEKESW
jgi:N-acetylmuramoyl-L-alanine amidase